MDILAFGQTTILKLQKLRILVYGLQPLGVEVCKSIGGLCPQELLVVDDQPITEKDSEQCFLYREEHIKQIRQDICLKGLKEMFSSLNIVVVKEDPRDKETLLKESVVKKYDLVVVTECLDL